MNSGRFRLVYSRNLAMFVPVPEVALTSGHKSVSKRRRSRHLLAASAFLLVAAQEVLAAPPVGALPNNGAITSGTGSIATTGNAMTVNQSTPKMIVNWGSFNIGSAASVKFAQPNVNSAVLNRVSGAGGSSQIYGNLTANGQVFLINPNGILFGKGASVNVNTLVASSLDISDTLFNLGILSQQQDGIAVFTGNSGFVQVDPGAALTAATGGKIMLFAPNVTNNGLIQTPDGQTLLAAGEKIYLAASQESNLRGLLVEVDSGGKTENLGQIIAQRGNITLAGIAVNQNGRLTASTSVTANGSIKLQARDTTIIPGDSRARVATVGGTVQLGKNSITEVLPETADKTTVLDTTIVQNSVIDILGSSIRLMDNAWLVSPGGNINLYAGLNPSESTINRTSTFATPNASRIYFESGSGIDVSGVGSGSQVTSRSGETAAQKSVADNIVQAELRGNELRDSPLQRNGILYKSKVFVDSRTKGINGDVGTSVADVGGYTAQIGHTVGERLAKGGSVKVQSEGDVVFNAGASINVSGGKVDYTGGKVTSTMLVAANGKVYDIANAPKELTYSAIKNVSHMEQGYTEGKDAGSVLFSAPAMVLRGNLKGNAVAGLHQRSLDSRPDGATLQIGQNSIPSGAGVDFLRFTHVLHSDLVFDAGLGELTAPAFSEALSSEQEQTLHLSQNFYAPSGFSNLLYFADGQITVEKGSNLQTEAGGSISLNAGGMRVMGNLTVHSGTVALSVKELNGYIGSQRPEDFANNATMTIDIASGSLLDVSGRWINDTLNPLSSDILAIAGGKISLSASASVSGKNGGNVLLNSSSVLNASGGAWLNSAGKLNSGNGGEITLKASGGIVDAESHHGKLALNGTIRADSLTSGGSLSLTSGSVTIGSAALGTPGELLIAPSLFRNGGFNHYAINSYENLTLADDTKIAPVAQTRVLDRNFANQVTGTDITGFSHLELLPSTGLAPIRKPVSVSLTASTETTGNLHLGAGSSIAVDPGASVTLAGKRQLTALGAITAPAGKISMTVGTTPEDGNVVKYLNNQTLWLGANSILDVSGVADVYTNSNGLRVGSVKNAGSITLNAEKGAVVAEKGAVLNLNGTQAVLDLKSGNGYVAREVASNGGTLSISAREGVLFDADMNAHGGNNSVAAGDFWLNLNKWLDPAINSNISEIENQYPVTPREILVKATGKAIPMDLKQGDGIDSTMNGQAFVFADKLTSAGFDSVTLSSRDNIRLTENVTLTTRGALTLDTPNLQVDDGVHALLSSSYVGIGNSQPIYQTSYIVDDSGNGSGYVKAPIAGTGSLAVHASNIELLGKQNLSGSQSTVFNSSGDIQLKGVLPENKTALTPMGGLNTAGDLTLKAARVFPANLSEYTLSSTGSDATITFEKNGSDSGVPYSVLGTLNVQAANIKQGGVLRAPFGVINLDAGYLDADNVKHPGVLTLMDGSLTSVSAEGKTLPLGNTTNGKDWSFDFGDRIRSFSVLPDKTINLDGQSVNVLAGSKIDVSGGGDLQAWEFTTGTGGSDDVLAATGVFAILPGLSSAYMPGNSQSYTNGGLEPGDMIYLSGGNGLAAGYFTLLPAHYALMPGGYSVKVVAGTQDRVAQQNTTNADGSMLISGYRLQSGGLTADSRSSGFLVTSGSILRTQSEFSDTFASNLFKSIYKDKQLTGYRLPDDAGRLAISAANNLVLDGAIAASHASTARGAEVDISSSNIAISADGSKEADYLTLDSAKLNAIGAESLLIGGTRSGAAEGTQVDVTANNIKLIGNASLSGSEIMLAAKDTVSLASGTSVHGSGLVSANSGDLIVGNAENAASGDGAILRVSSGEQRDLIRKGTSPVSEQVKGTLEIQSGATLAATGSIIADATYSNNLQGAVALSDGGALRLGAPKISFGNPASAVTGVLFDNSKLAALGNPGDLQLKSYSTFDFYGNVALGNSGLSSLTLESAGLAGFDNAGKSVTLTANKVKFTNLDGAPFTPEGALDSAALSSSALGTGTLAVNAKEIETGAGVFHTAGFNTVALTADQVVGKDTGGLEVAGDLSIDATRITAASLANQTLSASGHLQTLKHEPVGLSKAALGGKLTLAADTISHGGVIDMPAGVVTLKAAGSKGGDSLILQSGSQINNQGSAQYLGTVAALVDGGRVNLQTGNGNIRMENGAVIDVSATGGAGAGTLSVLSAGTANLDGTLYGAALAGNHVVTPKQGSFDLKAASLPDFSALNSALEQGKFNQSRNIHVAQGDLTIGVMETVTAHQFTLTTDDGDLTVAGKIDATGSKGGIVNLNAGQKAGDGKGNLTLASTAVIDASATTSAIESAGSTGDGGKVMLSTTTDGDTTPVTGSLINAASGSVINVSGKGLGSDGLVTLRAPRLGVADATSAGDGIAITNFGSTVTGVNATILAEGVKVYQNAGDLSLDSSFISTLEMDNASFMNNAGSIASSLGWASDSRFSVIAGDEVRSDGNISVDSDMNLQPWGNGALTLRAAGDINVNANISAGFSRADTKGKLSANGGGWTYRMTAGADLKSADVMTTNDIGVGNFTLASDMLIRSGTGDINIATGGSFNLGSDTSVIYTAGTPDNLDYSSLGSFINPTVRVGTTSFTAEYPVNGGDITLKAKGDINGAYTTQLPTNWWLHQGVVSDKTDLYTKNPSWWSIFSAFKENIGALGGGDVNITTSGNINDLSTVIATNGRVFGSKPADGNLVVNGGGDLAVQASGDIFGGLYFVDKGTANIRTSGGLLTGSQGFNTLFALGDGQVNVQTLGQLDMLTVFNPTLIGMSPLNGGRPSDTSFFSTYSPDSAATFISVASGIRLNNDQITFLSDQVNIVNSTISDGMMALFPSTLKAIALGDDLTLAANMTMAPAALGSLQFASGRSVLFNGSLNMADNEPTILPSVYSPIGSTRFVEPILFSSEGALYHAAGLLHINDNQPAAIYAGEDIIGIPSEIAVSLPKKATIFAERDIRNFTVVGQNLHDSDVSSISAGHDFIYTPLLDGFGNPGASNSGIVWGGPGYLNLSAGRNVDLSSGKGVVTRGNILNPFLSETGSSISILAGAANADDNAFIAKYANPSNSSIYSGDLVKFVETMTGLNGLSMDKAWTEFQTLDASLKHQFVQSMFFNELKMAGLEHNDSSSGNFGSYQRGYTAIDTLFANDSYIGNVDLSLSQIKTERGGELNIMAPGGKIVVGLPKLPTYITKGASEMGVFTVKGGDINAFSLDSIEVARSRVFTIAGGDVLMWSTVGDIDAGKGSKTATSAPPPLIRTDENGRTVIDLSGVVSGSGIGTLQTLPDVPPGNVYLIAPSGTVNAGDAGIRSSGNLLVASARVVGADNIQVGGVSSGVPQTQSSGINFSMGGLTDTTSASKSGDPSGNQQAASTAGNKSSFMPSFLTVEVIGMGDEAPSAGVKDDEEENKKNRKKSSPL